MTKNAKMPWPGEMETPTYEPTGPDTATARRRRKGIVATPAEIELYKYDPNGARSNRHPGIPVDCYDDINSPTYDD